MRLVGTVFLAIAPALVLLYFTDLPWTGFAVGVLALAAAWFGGERFVLRHVQRLLAAVQRLGSGDLSSRTDLADAPGEIGALASAFDQMAAHLEQRVTEREQTEQRSLNRALQQTAVAALGQFALTSNDFPALLNQATLLVSQTLEVEFCRVLELSPDRKSTTVRAGVGWKKGTVGMPGPGAGGRSQAAHTLGSGEPMVIADLRAETRFPNEPLLVEHSAVSGVSVAIGARDKTYGVLDVYSSRQRNFAGDDLQFLMAVANVLAVASERRRAESEALKLAEFVRLNPGPVLELAEDGTITYSNPAAQRMALALGREQTREVLPADIREHVQSCLASGQSKINLESRIEGRVLSWSLHPVASSQRRPLLRRRHHRPVEPGSAVAAVAKDGVHRPARRRRRA